MILLRIKSKKISAQTTLIFFTDECQVKKAVFDFALRNKKAACDADGEVDKGRSV